MNPRAVRLARLVKTVRLLAVLSLAVLTQGARADSFLSVGVGVYGDLPAKWNEITQVVPMIQVDASRLDGDWYYYSVSVSEIDWNDDQRASVDRHWGSGIDDSDYGDQAYAVVGPLAYWVYDYSAPGTYRGEVTATVARYDDDQIPGWSMPREGNTQTETVPFEFTIPDPSPPEPGATVPEPAAAVLGGIAALGGVALAAARRRRRG